MAGKLLGFFEGERRGFKTVLSPLLTFDLARSKSERAKGLMLCTHLPVHTGMLFAMGNLGRHGFWMHKTPLALDIAWLARDGRVQEMAQLQPFDERTVQPREDAFYVIEMNAGALRSYGVQAGDRLVIQR